MSEEEKKAIEIIKEFRANGYSYVQIKYGTTRIETNTMIDRNLDILFNLIEKQEKEKEKYIEIFNCKLGVDLSFDDIKTKLEDIIYDLENAIDIKDINNVSDDLKRIVKSM